jgi:hypothetical protein
MKKSFFVLSLTIAAILTCATGFETGQAVRGIGRKQASKKIQESICSKASDESIHNDCSASSSGPVAVILEYSDAFDLSKESCDSLCDVLTRRERLRNYFTTANEKRISDLGFTSYSSLDYGWYGPFIEFHYEKYSDFSDNDLKKLGIEDVPGLIHIFVEDSAPKDEATRVTASYATDFPFSDALSDIEIPATKTYF